MKIRYSSGGEEIGIVSPGFAEAVSVGSGFTVRPFDDEAQAVAFLQGFLEVGSVGEEEGGGWIQELARRVVAGDLVVISRTRPAPAFLHPRPIEASPRQVEEALRQRDPEPTNPPPPEEPVEPMVVKPEQLKTDAPLCEL